jgi:hypothetical protein
MLRCEYDLGALLSDLHKSTEHLTGLQVCHLPISTVSIFASVRSRLDWKTVVVSSDATAGRGH